MSLYIPKMSDTPGVTIPGLASNFQALDGSQIVEWGSNENGTYWRWESGLQICCHVLSSRPSATNVRQDEEWNFPASFASRPTFVSVKAMGRPEDYDQIDIREVRSWSNTRLHYSWSTSVSGLNVYRTLLAIGLWK